MQNLICWKFKTCCREQQSPWDRVSSEHFNSFFFHIRSQLVRMIRNLTEFCITGMTENSKNSWKQFDTVFHLLGHFNHYEFSCDWLQIHAQRAFHMLLKILSPSWIIASALRPEQKVAQRKVSRYTFSVYESTRYLSLIRLRCSTSTFSWNCCLRSLHVHDIFHGKGSDLSENGAFSAKSLK